MQVVVQQHVLTFLNTQHPTQALVLRGNPTWLQPKGCRAAELNRPILASLSGARYRYAKHDLGSMPACCPFLRPPPKERFVDPEWSRNRDMMIGRKITTCTQLLELAHTQAPMYL